MPYGDVNLLKLPDDVPDEKGLSLSTLGSVDEVARARTPESKVCVWSRSLNLIDSIG